MNDDLRYPIGPYERPTDRLAQFAFLALAALCLTLFPPASAAAGDAVPGALTGTWTGSVELPGIALEVWIDLLPATSGWQGTIDIPLQGVADRAFAEISVSGEQVALTLDAPGAPTLIGQLQGDSLSGSLAQGGREFPFELSRLARPQRVYPPYPYEVEELTYEQGGSTLAGTLTLPPGEGPFPAAVLLSGSGPQNRDQEILGHRPFLLLADRLTRQGIAVLRSDDRGVGGSQGDILAAATEDFAADALAAVERLAGHPKIDAGRIGLIGHSEGGMVAQSAAADGGDRVAFAVLLAAPAVPGDELLVRQAELTALAEGADAAAAAEYRGMMERAVELLRAPEADPAALQSALLAVVRRERELIGGPEMPEPVLVAQAGSYTSRWFRAFLAYDPAPALSRIEVPVLALYGAVDRQVEPAQNLPALTAGLAAAGNLDVTARRLPGLNHLLQPSDSGAVSEYGEIATTLAPEVLQLIGDWVAERVGADH